GNSRLVGPRDTAGKGHPAASMTSVNPPAPSQDALVPSNGAVTRIPVRSAEKTAQVRPPVAVRSGQVAKGYERSADLRRGAVRILVPVTRRAGTIAPRTPRRARPTVERPRTPHPATERDQTVDDPRPCRPAAPVPGASRPRSTRSATPGGHAGRRLRADVDRSPRPAEDDARLGRQRVQLRLRAPAPDPDESGPRIGRSPRAEGGLHPRFGRPLAKQGHDRPELLRPHDPRTQLQRLPRARPEGLL